MENRAKSIDGNHLVGLGDIKEADHFARFGELFCVDVNVIGKIDEDPATDGLAEGLDDGATIDAYMDIYKEIRGGNTTESAEEAQRRTAARLIENGAVVIELATTKYSKKDLDGLQAYVKIVLLADEPRSPIGGTWTYASSKYL